MEHLVGVEVEVAVDLAGGDVVEPGDPARPPGRLQEGLGADDVGAEEPARVEDGQAVVRLGREVHDRVDLVLAEGALGPLQVADVAPDEGDPVADVVEVGQVAGVGEQVVGHHVVAGVVLGPVTDEVGTDEPGTAGNEESHGANATGPASPGANDPGSGAGPAATQHSTPGGRVVGPSVVGGAVVDVGWPSVVVVGPPAPAPLVAMVVVGRGAGATGPTVIPS